MGGWTAVNGRPGNGGWQGPPTPLEWSCLTLDGTDDRVDVTGIPFSGTNRTFACLFFAATSPVGRDYLFDAFSPRCVYSLYETGNISMFDGAWRQFGAFSADDAWHSIVFSTAGTSTSCYLDGVQFGSTLTTSAITPGGNMSLGSSHSGGADYFKGRLSNVVLDTTAWSLADAQAFDSANTVPSAVARYKLCEGTGLVAEDSAGSNDGTIIAVESEAWANTQTRFAC